MGLVSGSISLDMSKVQRELSTVVKEAIAEELVHAITVINANILAQDQQAVSILEMEIILASNLPEHAVEYSTDTRRHSAARHQAEQLMMSGYRLIQVPENSLKAATELADARLAIAQRDGSEDSWFERDED